MRLSRTLLALSLVMIAANDSAFAADAASLTLGGTIALPGVTGRIDHMDVDVTGQRLFVSALGSDAVEVIDLRAGKRVGELKSLHEPQGVRYVPELRRLFVANAGGGGVLAFGDASTLVATSGNEIADDADNLRYDASNSTLVLGYGKALATLDPRTLKVRQNVPLAGHPEAFVVERSGHRIFVNVPTAGQIAVVDKGSGQVSKVWDIGAGRRNFPMALDEADALLFVVTRTPAQLLVFDTTLGRQVAVVNTWRDADDLFYDVARRQIYVVCGEGMVAVLRQENTGQYVEIARIETAPGARTGYFAPELSMLYVAAPAPFGGQAEIRMYKLAPAKPP
jgi:DNA-binding beta-propeller fold protein YncE